VDGSQKERRQIVPTAINGLTRSDTGRATCTASKSIVDMPEKH
jgi:hypothetical protein